MKIATKHEITILAVAAVFSLAALNFAPAASGANSRGGKAASISNVAVSHVTPYTAIVTWTTDIPTTGVAYYGLSPSKALSGSGGSNEPVTNHAAVLMHLSPSTKYFVYVDVADNSKGNGKNGITTFTTLAPAPYDVTPPTAPIVSATGVSETEIRISWSGALDQSGIASYAVFRDGAGVASLNGIASEWLDTVMPRSAHTYHLRVYDAAGNFADTAQIAAGTIGAAPLAQ